jgi:hypothetical protein
MKKIIFFGLMIIGLATFSLIQTNMVEAASNNTLETVCSNADMKDVEGIINWASCALVRSVIPLLVALAVIGFIWGVIQYFLNPDNEEKKKNGKTFMLWGIIALFVMTSIWGLVNVFSGTFKTGKPVVPTFPEQ